MENKDIELRSPKVRNVIGRMPRGLTVTAITIYLVVLLLIAGIVVLLDMDIEGMEMLNRLLGK